MVITSQNGSDDLKFGRKQWKSLPQLMSWRALPLSLSSAPAFLTPHLLKHHQSDHLQFKYPTAIYDINCTVSIHKNSEARAKWVQAVLAQLQVRSVPALWPFGPLAHCALAPTHCFQRLQFSKGLIDPNATNIVSPSGPGWVTGIRCLGHVNGMKHQRPEK